MVKYSYLSLSRGFTSMVSSNYGSPSIHNGLKNWVKLAFYFREGKGVHSSTLAWRIPWVEEPGGLQCMGLLRVGHN